MQESSEERTIGEFTIVRLVGQGTFGSVFLVKHSSTQAYFAIKTPRKDSTGKVNPSYSSLFAKEASILRQLSHRNVIRFIKTVEEGAACSVVLEYVSGVDLGKLLREREDSFSEREAAEIVKNIIAGILHIHSRGIVHRDLKPRRHSFIR